MNLIEAKKILRPDKPVWCDGCDNRFFSPYDKVYITVKGKCYTCDPDDTLSDNVFKAIA